MENNEISTDIMIVNPATLMRQATDVAGVSRQIVLQTAMKIQGRQYIKVEGWQAIAIAHGCVLSARDVQAVEGGISAIGEVRRISDGQIIATAEGFVGDDEKTWASRPMYAKRAMAQTRAMSRAARSAFAHVVVMIDKDLSTTPAEEMQFLEDEKPEPKKEQKPAPQKPAEPPMSKQADVIDPLATLPSDLATKFREINLSRPEARQLFVVNGSSWEKVQKFGEFAQWDKAVMLDMCKKEAAS